MASGVDTVLAAIGLMLAAGFISTWLFRKYRFPDILFLIAFGAFLGPVTHVLDVEAFRSIASLVATLAIIIILFDGGLEIQIQELRSGVASGTMLGVAVFVTTSLLCAGVAHVVAGISALNAVLLGMALGGAGVVIVIPLIHHLGVSQRAITVVSLEAAVSDVLVVLGVYGVSTAIVLQRNDPLNLAEGIITTFSVGILAGAAAGYLWAAAMNAVRQVGYEYTLTVAVLLMLHAVVEFLGGSGPLSVLVFGFVLGNSRKAAVGATGKARSRRKELLPVFDRSLHGFHQEIVFFIRTFFFVLLGVVLDLSIFSSGRFLLVGVLLTAGVVTARWWGVNILFRRGDMEAWDRLAVSLMFPLGLAAAALSLVPSQRFGIPGTEDFGNYAAVTIVLTNLATSALVYYYSMPGTRRRLGLPPREPVATPEAA